MRENNLLQGNVSQKEGARKPLVCYTCGAVHQPEKKTPQEHCKTPISYLTCDVADHHHAAYTLVSGWKPGESCPQSTYGCKGTLLDVGLTGPCPGRLK